MHMSAKDNGILRTIHKHDDGTYEVCIKRGDISHRIVEPTLQAATEKLKEWYEKLVKGEA